MGTHTQGAGSHSSKDGREADFPIYKYRTLDFSETSGFSRRGCKSGSGFPGGERMQGKLPQMFHLDPSWLHGCVHPLSFHGAVLL